ncbi:MAG TPA: MOSC domain-containing protein [Planctomycetota bacterium]|nr:MOSC domain-containing protein [Planctomycetota bacterium]
MVSIHRVQKKGGPAEALSEANFVTNFGLEGDWRSRKGRGRQITLIEEEALIAVAAMLKMPSIPSGASRRQVVVRGLALNDTVGKRLRVGPLLIEIHDLCDPCRNMETMIGRDAKRAMKNRGGICGRVIEGGILRPGDTVCVLPTV